MIQHVLRQAECVLWRPRLHKRTCDKCAVVCRLGVFDIICGMEKLATDIDTFSELVKNGFTYRNGFSCIGKTLTLIGLAFSKEKRIIVDAVVERL